MVIDLRRKKTPTTFLVIKGHTVEMVDSFWFFGTTTNRNEMGGQYDINRQEGPTVSESSHRWAVVVFPPRPIFLDFLRFWW